MYIRGKQKKTKKQNRSARDGSWDPSYAICGPLLMSSAALPLFSTWWPQQPTGNEILREVIEQKVDGKVNRKSIRGAQKETLYNYLPLIQLLAIQIHRYRKKERKKKPCKKPFEVAD